MKRRICKCCGLPSQSVHSNLCAACEASELWFDGKDDDYDPDEEHRSDYGAKLDDEMLRRVDP